MLEGSCNRCRAAATAGASGATNTVRTTCAQDGAEPDSHGHRFATCTVQPRGASLLLVSKQSVSAPQTRTAQDR